MLALGDNYYHSGVTEEADPRFQSTFESVYTPESLQFPWYVVAGNHDHAGNVTAQIAYSQDSKRWIFPSKYHAHSFTADDGATIDIILIDTVDLSSLSLAKSKEEKGFFDPLPEQPLSKDQTQWTWIEEQLKSSKADYILVGGHYPVYSVCEHGPTSTLVTNLRPLLMQYGAHYVAGHDHCMEHLKESTGTTNYYLAGMGVECCYDSSNLKKVPTGSLQWYIASDNKGKNTIGGFVMFEVSKQGLTAFFYDQDGSVLYTAPTVGPRTTAAQK